MTKIDWEPPFYRKPQRKLKDRRIISRKVSLQDALYFEQSHVIYLHPDYRNLSSPRMILDGRDNMLVRSDQPAYRGHPRMTGRVEV